MKDFEIYATLKSQLDAQLEEAKKIIMKIEKHNLELGIILADVQRTRSGMERLENTLFDFLKK